MQLFIDTNIYLEYFRENSRERLKPLQALVDLVKEDKIKLLLPAQTKQEYYRNRRTIAQTTRAALLKQSQHLFLVPALMDKDSKEITKINKLADDNQKLYKK